MTNGKQGLKILFAGLDNAGKTSIILTIDERYSKLRNLKPTIGAETHDFEILGNPVVRWDMGGQKNLREQYLLDKKLFQHTDLLCYVIDIMDSKRFYESLTYLFQIVEIFDSYGDEPRIIVLLHKVDPDIAHEERIQSKVSEAINMFEKEEKFKKYGMKFFETSIYNPWSLLKAFSYGIKSISATKKVQDLEAILKEFTDKSNSTALVILDNNQISLGEVYLDELTQTIIDKLIPNLIAAYNNIKGISIYKIEKLIVELSDYYLLLTQFKLENGSFYIVLLTKEQNIAEMIKDSIPALAKKIEKIITGFFFENS
ncbi:MAG: ADP-ribosylation factor-like protein [Candidatus Helarchaeota archaeon]